MKTNIVNFGLLTLCVACAVSLSTTKPPARTPAMRLLCLPTPVRYAGRRGASPPRNALDTMSVGAVAGPLPVP